MEKNKVYLVQTDTTVGFLSANSKQLSKIKKRSEDQKILQTIDSFKILKQNTRIPKNYKQTIRRSKLKTFIYPDGNSFRLVDQKSKHHNFISKFHKLYSTSANETGKNFQLQYAHEQSDIMVITKENYEERTASSIFKLYKKKMKKLR